VSTSGPEPSQLALDAKDVFVKFWSTLHEATYEITEGRILDRVLGMRVVRLTTVGRRTGKTRTTILTAPVVEKDRVVLIASNGGDVRHPQWFHNLVANADVTATWGGRTRRMRARVVEADERERLWAEIRHITPGYSIYQRMTSRQIPVVVLEPM
jgi:deazaflavin-dependent oxidoreductase (nitroreductase family)